MWDFKEHNNSGAIIRTCQNLFILAEFLTFWHALETFIGNKKESYTFPLFMIRISVTLSLFLVMCEVRSKWCVLCWPHASTSALWCSDLAGKVCKSEQSKAKQPWQHQPGRARREARPGHRYWPDCGSEQRTLIGQLSCTRLLIGWYRSGPGCGDWEDHTKPHISASITLCPLVKHITISYIQYNLEFCVSSGELDDLTSFHYCVARSLCCVASLIFGLSPAIRAQAACSQRLLQFFTGMCELF